MAVILELLDGISSIGKKKIDCFSIHIGLHNGTMEIVNEFGTDFSIIDRKSTTAYSIVKFIKFKITTDLERNYYELGGKMEPANAATIFQKYASLLLQSLCALWKEYPLISLVRETPKRGR